MGQKKTHLSGSHEDFQTEAAKKIRRKRITKPSFAKVQDLWIESAKKSRGSEEG